MDTPYGHTVLPMDRAADHLIDVTWVAWCAERLREQWPRADATSLEETARELWGDETVRLMGPRQAAEKWLRRGTPGGPDAEAVAPEGHLCRSAGSPSQAR